MIEIWILKFEFYLEMGICILFIDQKYMTTVYRPILKTAWQIVWRAKYLWFFGFFAAFIASSGELNMVINNFSDLNNGVSFLDNVSQSYSAGILSNVFNNAKVLINSFNLMTVLLLLILLAIFLFFVWLSVVAEAGLIAGAYREYRKQASDFSLSFKTGRQNFWKILGLNILGKVAVYVALLIVSLPFLWAYLKTTSDTWQLILFLLSFVILIPLAAIISFLMKYAIMYVLLQKEKFWQAVAKGWQLFLKNWIVSLEMAILMFLITVLTGVAMILVVIILAIPLAFVLYILYVLNIAGFMYIGIILALLVVAVILFWFGAMLVAYQNTAWVLLFDRLNEGQIFPKITRLIAGFITRKEKIS